MTAVRHLNLAGSLARTAVQAGLETALIAEFEKKHCLDFMISSD
jgi:hypothetical protein